MKFVNPTREQFKFIHGLPQEQPVCMLNMLKFLDIAQYEKSDQKYIGAPVSGRDAYECCSSAAQAGFQHAGGSHLWLGQPLTTMTGPTQVDQWDVVFVANYPTARAFIELVKSAEYQNPTRHTMAALEASRLVVCSQLEAGASFSPLRYLPVIDGA